MPGFAELPARIEALTREHERVAVVLLDAFGWAFVQRHAEHPLLARMEIEPLASQFPSTTTAHLTTLHTGLPVEQHGLYEWHIYEPSLDAMITPLPFVPARREDPPLDLDPRELVPGPTFFERLDVASVALQPAAIWPGKYSSATLSGARVVPFASLAEGVGQLGAAPGLTYLYWDAIDAAGHRHGPSSHEFDAAAVGALDLLERAPLPPGTMLLVTADHGQIDVSADRLDELDVLWPELLDRLRRDGRGRPLPPAGSARDCFLHVDDPPGVVAALRAAVGERAEVHLAADLFPDAGPNLRARLADVCVLPAPGRMAWLRAFPSYQTRFRGHHGGRTPEEAETWVGLLQA
jgi:Type I phosphodiesterase / nucleotide pyrophosphatase